MKHRIPTAQEMIARIDKCNSIKYKGDNEPGEETAYRMGENLCHLSIRQGINIQNIYRTQKIKIQMSK
jgi:hypothetical protein